MRVQMFWLDSRGPPGRRCQHPVNTCDRVERGGNDGQFCCTRYDCEMPGRPSAGEGKRRGPALFKTTECTHRWSAERKLADGSTVRVCEKCKAIEFLERWKDATSPGKVKKTRSGAKKGKSVGVSQPTSASKSGAKRGAVSYTHLTLPTIYSV